MKNNFLVGIICPSSVADAGSTCLQSHAVSVSTRHLLHPFVNPLAVLLGMKAVFVFGGRGAKR